ncbi:hypothetical protein Chor_014477 [Crotalus horridus]
MVEYKRAMFQEDEVLDAPGDGSNTSPDSIEVGFRKGDGLFLSRLGSQIQLKLVFWVISLFVAVLLLSTIIAMAIQYSKAGKILEALDPDVKPCDDFYQYACGGWIKRNPLPDGRSKWSTFNSIWDQNQAIMKHLLENATFNSSSEAERKTQRYYLSCLREQKIEELGSQPLIDLIEKIGGWNVTGSWNQTNFMDVLKLVSATYRASPFFTVFVGPDSKSSNSNIIQVLSAYLEYMVELAMLLGGARSAVEEQMGQVLLLETQLANITVPQDERRDDEKIYHKMTIADLQVLAPAVEWLDFISYFLAPLDLTDAEPVVVYGREYLEQVSQLINNTDKSRYVDQTLFKNWSLEIPPVVCVGWNMRGFEADRCQSCTPRWQTCISNTDDTLGFALGALFVKATFDRHSKEIVSIFSQAENMIADIRAAFEDSLNNLDWMDKKTKQTAKEKYEVSEDSFFQNMLNFYNFSARFMADQLRKPPNRDQWSMTPQTVNAYYLPTKNGIVFPAGILQAPFYAHNHPKALNFGGIGVVMGHELTHAFDDQAFKNRTECMEEQYSKYLVNGEHVNGKQTLGENIADNGGLKAAYNAYKSWLKKNGEEKHLPSVGLTSHQLFFLGFAQVSTSGCFCSPYFLCPFSGPES